MYRLLNIKDNKMQYEIDEVEPIEYLGEIDDYFYDVGMVDTPHTFFANDILVHNSLYTSAGNVLRSFNWPHINDIEKTSKFLDEKITPIFVKVIDAAEKKLALKSMNCPDCKITFKREMIARRALFLAKKRYIAWVIIGEDGPVTPDSSHEIEIKGLEAVRSSTPEGVRTAFKEFYKSLIKTVDRTIVDNVVRDTYNKLMQCSPLDIAKNSSANNIQKYTMFNGEPDKGTPSHIKGCIGYNKLLKLANLESDYEHIMEGDKVKVVYIKGCDRFPTYRGDVISFKSKFPKELLLNVDMEKMVDKMYIQPLQQFYDIMGWQLPSTKTENIEDFFE
jgi:DNA polymerase elongation subunit (family B)